MFPTKVALEIEAILKMNNPMRITSNVISITDLNPFCGINLFTHFIIQGAMGRQKNIPKKNASQTEGSIIGSGLVRGKGRTSTGPPNPTNLPKNFTAKSGDGVRKKTHPINTIESV